MSQRDRKTAVEECRWLSIAEFVKCGLFEHYQFSATARFDQQFEIIIVYRPNFVKAFVEPEAARQWNDEAVKQGGTLELSYAVEAAHPVQDEIEIVAIASPLNWRKGKKRYFFVCPGNGRPCGRRAGKLYMPPGEDCFRCRRCFDLTYRSNRRSKWEKRLGWWKLEKSLGPYPVALATLVAFANRRKALENRRRRRRWERAMGKGPRR